MQRPNKPKVYSCSSSILGYIRNLEKYCDKIEQRLVNYKAIYDIDSITLSRYEEENVALTRALQKTCAKLNSSGRCAYSKTPCQKNISCQECWEGWAMENE